MKPLDVVRTFGIFLMETAQKDQMIKQNLPMYTITTTLGSEIRKFTAVNSSLSAGIPVLVKLLCLMESCNVYNHSHRKSFFVFTNISALRIFCLSRAVAFLDFRNFRRKILCCTSSHSFERSECARSDFVTKHWDTIGAAGHDWSLGYATLHRSPKKCRTSALTAPRHGPSRESRSAATHHTCTGQELRHFRAETFQDCFGG